MSATPSLVVDVDYRAQYDWLSTWGLDGVVRRAQPVCQARLGTHDGVVVLNGRVKCPAEHPILIRRDDQWGFVSAEFIEVGDALFIDGVRSANPVFHDAVGSVTLAG